ncbi:hypothetical protein [Nocardia sp. NPDC003963]
MSAGWVAGNVRAAGLCGRRLGVERTRELARAGALDAAQRVLARSSYRRDLRIGATLLETELAVSATLLWHLRVLAGWQSRRGARMIRTLAGGFEIANIGALAARLAGAAPCGEYELGTLDWAWNRLRHARTLSELSAALQNSVWGDPGGETARDIVDVALSVWADRVAATVPIGRAWAHGAVALLTARRIFAEPQPLPLPGPLSRHVAHLLGPAALSVTDLSSYRTALPSTARWVLADVDTVPDLWHAEFSWWRRLGTDGATLMADMPFGASLPVGATALLAVDAWQVRAALQVAAGTGNPEEFDELV